MLLFPVPSRGRLLVSTPLLLPLQRGLVRLQSLLSQPTWLDLALSLQLVPLLATRTVMLQQLTTIKQLVR